MAFLLSFPDLAFLISPIEGPTTKVPNLKQFDPAVMYYSSKTNVARYDKRELMQLKESKTAQAPPTIFYEPRIIRLNILKYNQTHPDDYQIQMNKFREMLPNLSPTLNPNLLDLLNNYHRSLLYPNYNYSSNGKTTQSTSSRSDSSLSICRLQQFPVTSGSQPELQSTRFVGGSEAVHPESMRQCSRLRSEVWKFDLQLRA